MDAVRATGDDLLQAIVSAGAVGSADLSQQVSSLFPLSEVLPQQFAQRCSLHHVPYFDNGLRELLSSWRTRGTSGLCSTEGSRLGTQHHVARHKSLPGCAPAVHDVNGVWPALVTVHVVLAAGGCAVGGRRGDEWRQGAVGGARANTGRCSGGSWRASAP